MEDYMKKFLLFDERFDIDLNNRIRYLEIIDRFLQYYSEALEELEEENKGIMTAASFVEILDRIESKYDNAGIEQGRKEERLAITKNLLEKISEEDFLKLGFLKEETMMAK